MALRELAENLWVWDHHIPLMGIATPIRMTVARYGDRRLWVHSPVGLRPEIREALAPLGEVSDLVGPNCFHHLYLREWINAFPKAKVWLAPGLTEKTGIPGTTLLSTTHPAPEWCTDLPYLNLEGLKTTNEVVFLHGPSRTLVLADLFFNIQEVRGLWANLFWRMNDAHRRLGMSRVFRTFISVREEFKKSLRQVDNWDFQRIVMAHGEVVDQDARERWRTALKGWL